MKIEDYPEIPKDLIEPIERLTRYHNQYTVMQTELEKEFSDRGLYIFHTGRVWNWTMIKHKAKMGK